MRSIAIAKALLPLTAAVAATAGAGPVYWDGGPVVIVNATDRIRSYVLRDAERYVDLSRRIVLPPGALCRLDSDAYHDPPDTRDGPVLLRASTEAEPGQFVEDVSEGYRGVMNGPYLRDPGPSCTACTEPVYGIRELLACSGAAAQRCAGARWGSWQVALLAPEQQTLAYRCGWHAFAMTCTMEFAPNRLYWPQSDWGLVSGGAPSAGALRYRAQTAKALLLVQGGVDGHGFDMHRLNPIHGPDVFGARLCSTLTGVAPPQ